MRRILLLLIFLSSCHHYKGYVKDFSSEKPIKDVYLGYSDSTFYILTDSLGFYEGSSMHKIRSLVVKHENYRTRKLYHFNPITNKQGAWNGGDIYLVQAGYSGYVFDNAGKPLNEVEVFAITETDSLRQHTDENGYFNFEDCNEFVFSISFKKAGYVSTDVSCHFLPPRQILFKGDTIYLEQMND